MDPVAALATFLVILPAELPDKTMVATLVLSTRFRPLLVWLGVVAAFFVQCLVAVAAGGLLLLLPRRPVLAVTAALFAVGAVLLWRHARRADEEEAEDEREYAARAAGQARGWRVSALSFGVLFAAEWGTCRSWRRRGWPRATGSRCRCSSAPGRHWPSWPASRPRQDGRCCASFPSAPSAG